MPSYNLRKLGTESRQNRNDGNDPVSDFLEQPDAAFRLRRFY
jgi:hypothetical protein